MLRDLRIKNLAIIDNVSMEFGEGFNVLTGETGAGKSIIIGALCLALGERAGGDLIRSGEKEALVEAFFDLPPTKLERSLLNNLKDMGMDLEDGFILKRMISAQGRNRAYLNGSMVNLQTLSDISGSFIDVHGQYEHQSLLSSARQLAFLDSFGGLTKEKEIFRSLYEKYVTLKDQIAELHMEEKERAQRIDMLKFQTDEITAVDVNDGEDEELEREARVLGNAAQLAELAHGAYDSLYVSETSSISALSKIREDLKKIADIDGDAAGSVETLDNTLLLLEETAYFLRDYRERVAFDPEQLDAVQARIEQIRGLKRKYGEDIGQILAFKQKAEEELEILQHSEERLESLTAELTALRKDLTAAAQVLSKRRTATARKMERLVKEELSGLSMPDAAFSINIAPAEGEDTTDGCRARPDGTDIVEFLIAPNRGEELRPLSKIASGGELSRMMLAMKSIMTGVDETPVIVFDEIDAGIGGATAERVGQRLKGLSAGHQVICITHLPQIASYADRHLKIEKAVKGKRTTVAVRPVEEDERAEEIARMLSGDISKVSLKHAKEMLQAKGR